MKIHKIILPMLIIILLSSIGVYASDYREEVRVGLKYGQNAGTSFTVSSEGGVIIYNAKTGDVLYTSVAGESVYIEMGSTGFASFGKFDASGISLISIQPQNGKLISFDGKKYRGYIIAQRRASGEMNIINAVSTEDYVASVLGKEMSYSWPKEALKAQAVCARNFVLCRGNAHKDYEFDVCTTTHCQVYGGFDSEHENTRQAALETKGILARYEGKVVPLFFFATSGGQTENVENVWGNVVGYLKGVNDTYEKPDKASKYKWSTSLTKNEIEAKLSNVGASIGSLKNVTIDSTTSSGRVTKMTFHGTEGEYTTKLEKCRTVLELYSQRFIISGDTTSAIITTAGVAAGPYAAQTSEGKKPLYTLRTLNGNGQINEIKLSAEGSQNYSIDGGGYGHGVGMSQWGARGMAENGFTYDKILHYYFTNITLGE